MLTFLIDDELDLAELQFRELYDVIDKFVVLESRMTFSGNDDPKPLHFQDNKHRFKDWADKIIVAEVPRYTGEAWPAIIAMGAGDPLAVTRECYSRDWVRRVIPKLEPYDSVLIANVDEIAKAEMVKSYDTKEGGVQFETQWSHFWFNYTCNEPAKALNIYPGYAYNITSPWLLRCRYRDIWDGCRFPAGNTRLRAGWHFSYPMGPKGIEQIRHKLRVYAHHTQRHGLPALARIQNGGTINPKTIGVQQTSNGDYIFKKTSTDLLPKYVRENLDKYRKLGYILD